MSEVTLKWRFIRPVWTLIFTVRRHKFNKDSCFFPPLWWIPSQSLRCTTSSRLSYDTLSYSQPSVSHLDCTAGSSRSFTAIRKDAGLCSGSRLRKGEVFAYVGRNQNLKDLKADGAGKLKTMTGRRRTQMGFDCSAHSYFVSMFFWWRGGRGVDVGLIQSTKAPLIEGSTQISSSSSPLFSLPVLESP